MSKHRRNNWRSVGYPAGVIVAGRPERRPSSFPRREMGPIGVSNVHTGESRTYVTVEEYARSEGYA